MIIIKLQGGLGNQMFQYAVGRTIEARTSLPVVFDTTTYHGGTAARDTVRTLGLDNFNTTIKEAALEDINKSQTPFRIFLFKLKNRLIRPNWYSVDPSVFTAQDGTYLQGWWQTEGYFRDYADLIRTEFTLKKPLGVTAQSLYLKIKELKEAGIAPVSLHIRRGDYITNKHAAAHHGVLDLSYYKNALQEIKMKESKTLQIFVFSDDIEWARTHLQSDITLNFVSSPEIRDYEELMLMSACAHHIIANSSFSWWGAWLNPSSTKIVVAPKQWITNSSVDTTAATPAEWIRL